MGRHKAAITKALIAVRLEPSTVDELDAMCELFSSEWFQASRSDVVRALLMYALNEWKQNNEEMAEALGIAPTPKRGRPKKKP